MPANAAVIGNNYSLELEEGLELNTIKLIES